MMTKRIVVDDIQKKDTREKEKTLRVKLQSKLVTELKQAELLELVQLLAQKAGLVGADGKVSKGKY
jgi:hypothetical protein